MANDDRETVITRVDLDRGLGYGGRHLHYEDLRIQGWVDEKYKPIKDFDTVPHIEPASSDSPEHVVWTAIKRTG